MTTRRLADIPVAAAISAFDHISLDDAAGAAEALRNTVLFGNTEAIDETPGAAPQHVILALSALEQASAHFKIAASLMRDHDEAKAVLLKLDLKFAELDRVMGRVPL